MSEDDALRWALEESSRMEEEFEAKANFEEFDDDDDDDEVEEGVCSDDGYDEYDDFNEDDPSDGHFEEAYTVLVHIMRFPDDERSRAALANSAGFDVAYAVEQLLSAPASSNLGGGGSGGGGSGGSGSGSGSGGRMEGGSDSGKNRNRGSFHGDERAAAARPVKPAPPPPRPRCEHAPPRSIRR